MEFIEITGNKTFDGLKTMMNCALGSNQMIAGV